MKYQSAITNLAAVVFATSSLDSVSAFVPKSCTRGSPAALLRDSYSCGKIGQAQTQLSVASSEIAENEADVKPRKTREVSLSSATLTESKPFVLFSYASSSTSRVLDALRRLQS